MSVKAVVAVVNNDPRDAQEEDHWGEYKFAELRSKGDQLILSRNYVGHVLEVKAIRHFGVADPLPEAVGAVPPRTSPIIQILAEWRRIL